LYDPRRLAGTFSALALVTAFLAAFAGVLRPVVGGRPSWLPASDPTMEPAAFKEAAGRVAGVLHSDKARGGPPSGRRIGVLLGTSTLQCGIDPVLLGSTSKTDGSRIDWLSLHAITANPADLEWITHRILDDLTPSVVVLAINPGTLARSDDYLSDPTSVDMTAIRAHLRSKYRTLLAEDASNAFLVPWNRLFPNRSRVGHWFHRGLFEWRFALFARLGYDLRAQYPANRDPWTSTPWTRDEVAPAMFLDYQVDGWWRKGWFDAANYDVDGPNYQAIVRMTRTFRSRGTWVVILLLPEPRRLREIVPLAAVTNLHVALEKSFGADQPPVIDCRESLPEDLFADAVHSMPRGRETFTPIAAKALRQVLSRATPGGKNP
jgi:hypothetical protein